MLKLTMALAAALLVAGCMQPADYETPPVVVQSPSGPVTCQLYTPGQVTWDRAINHPDNMHVAKADEICRAEGTRRLNARR